MRRLFTDTELDTLKAAGLPLADASSAEPTAEWRAKRPYQPIV